MIFAMTSTSFWLRRFALALIVGLCLGAAMSASALSISNVTVVNVTPSTFTVLWRTAAGAEPRIQVFSDASGTATLAGQLGIESFPLHTGSPEAGNRYERRQSKSMLSAKTRSYGWMQARVSRCAPGTTYYFRLTSSNATDVATYPESGSLPSVTTLAENSFVAESQQLLLEVPGLDNAGRVVVLTHSNSTYALSAVVGDGAGTNQVFFNLAELVDLAGQGNYLPIGEQEFTANLLAVQGSNELSERFRINFTGGFAVGHSVSNSFQIEFLALTVGSTIVRVGQTGSVPLRLDGNVAAAQITATLQVPTNRLGSLAISNLHPSVAAASVLPQSASNALVQLTARPGQFLSGGFDIGQIQFLALSNRSAFVPLQLLGTAATRGDSSVASNITSRAGRVVVIGREPLLETVSVDAPHKLILYGNPWTGYALQYTTNLADPSAWTHLSRLPLTNLFASLNGLPRSADATFYRALELADDPPALEARRLADGGRSLILFGRPGASYTLETNVNVGNRLGWRSATSHTLTNAFTFIQNVNTNLAPIFYRARRN
jgi:hypothetical protein